METRVPNRVVNDSAASRNDVVSTALSWLTSTPTSTKDFLRVSNQVPPGGIVIADDIDGSCRSSSNAVHGLPNVELFKRADRSYAVNIM